MELEKKWWESLSTPPKPKAEEAPIAGLLPAPPVAGLLPEPAAIPPKMQGYDMRKLLHRRGVWANDVTRKRNTGYFVVDFFGPQLESGVPCAEYWSQQIQRALPGIQILKTNNTVADWREDKPIIWACVQFRLTDLYQQSEVAA